MLMIIPNCSRIGGFHNPALDVSEPAEHAEQVERWLIQMAADAGLTGMEQLVSEMRSKVARLCASGFCPVQSSEMPGFTSLPAFLSLVAASSWFHAGVLGSRAWRSAPVDLQLLCEAAVRFCAKSAVPGYEPVPV
jgi:hypothetical protein